LVTAATFPARHGRRSCSLEIGQHVPIDDELFIADAVFIVRDLKERLVASNPRVDMLIIDAVGVSDVAPTAI
jgi:hypothetical protein